MTYRWIVDVSMELDFSQDETLRTGLRHRLCMLALTYFTTFDVSSEHVPAVLSNEEDFSIARECTAIVHDNTPLSPSDDNSLHLTRMLSRHRRLLHDFEPLFGQSFLPVLGRGGLTHASAYDNSLARLRPGCSRRNSSSCLALPRTEFSVDFLDSRGREENTLQLINKASCLSVENDSEDCRKR